MAPFLETGEPPHARAAWSCGGQHSEGRKFPIEAVFVPVKLDEGFDFSLFLEDLGFELPMNLMLLRMRQQHPVVVRALRQAIEAEPQPWEGWRTAGTLVVFRPPARRRGSRRSSPPREAARAEQDADVEDRLTNPDPGVQGSSVADLDDAAAVVGAPAVGDGAHRRPRAHGRQRCPRRCRRRAATPRPAAPAPRPPSARPQRLRADLERALSEIKRGGTTRRTSSCSPAWSAWSAPGSTRTPPAPRALKAAEASRAELAQRLERAEADRARAAEATEAAPGRRRRGRSAAPRRPSRRPATAPTAPSTFESRIRQLEKLAAATPRPATPT